MGYITGMHVDTGLRFSMNLSHENVYWENFLQLVGTGTGMPM